MHGAKPKNCQGERRSSSGNDHTTAQNMVNVEDYVDETWPKTCRLCRCGLSGPASAEEHFNGRRHRMALNGGLDRDEPEMYPPSVPILNNGMQTQHPVSLAMYNQAAYLGYWRGMPSTAAPRAGSPTGPRAGSAAALRAESPAAPRAGSPAAPRAGSTAAPRAGPMTAFTACSLPRQVFFIISSLLSRDRPITIKELQRAFDKFTFLTGTGSNSGRDDVKTTLLQYPALFEIHEKGHMPELVSMKIAIQVCADNATNRSCDDGTSGALHLCNYFLARPLQVDRADNNLIQEHQGYGEGHSRSESSYGDYYSDDDSDEYQQETGSRTTRVNNPIPKPSAPTSGYGQQARHPASPVMPSRVVQPGYGTGRVMTATGSTAFGRSALPRHVFEIIRIFIVSSENHNRCPPVPLDELHADFVKICQKMISLHVMKALLQQYPDVFGIYRDEPGPELVYAEIKIQVCAENATKGRCQERYCGALHLCKFLLAGLRCNFGGRCQYGHTMDAHNRRCLERIGLSDLTIEQLIKLLPEPERMLPSVCKFYNKLDGCKWKTGTKCSAMHLCLHYVKGDCDLSPCCRSHSLLDDQPKQLLQQYGFDITRDTEGILQDLRERWL